MCICIYVYTVRIEKSERRDDLAWIAYRDAKRNAERGSGRTRPDSKRQLWQQRSGDQFYPLPKSPVEK